jgi:hypothetical protein
MRPAWSCEPLTKGRWGTARSPTSNVSHWTSPDPDGWKIRSCAHAFFCCTTPKLSRCGNGGKSNIHGKKRWPMEDSNLRYSARS